MNDYIKREDAMAAVDKCRCDTFQQLNGMKGYLNAIPPANVAEVKHSVWRVASTDPDKEYECMRCKEAVGWKYLYCPNCGARMDGKSNE